MINNNSNNFKQFLNKRVLAIDYGTKNVGTATFQPGHEPFPLEHLLVLNKGREALLKELSSMIEDEFIEVVVVGLPHHKDGNRSAMTEEVDKFAHKLNAKNPNIPFYFQDETLSSTEAHSRMKNSPKYNFKLDMSRVDLVAATIILEDFINGETPCPI